MPSPRSVKCGRGAAAKTGMDLTAAAEGGSFRTHEGTVYTGTRKGSGSTYSAGDTDVGSTTRDPAVRGREKGTEIRTTHSIKSADLTRVELAVQQRLQTTSRPAVPPGGVSPSTPRVEGAADEIIEAVRRGATSTVHDLRTLPEKVASEAGLDRADFLLGLLREGGVTSAEELCWGQDWAVHFRYHPSESDAVHLAISTL